MAVAALSTAGFTQFINALSNVSASDKAWQSLQQSLASGNLTAAQTAFNTYQQLNQDVTSATGSLPNSQLSADLTALGGAIGSGNLSTAQLAFATVQNDLKSAPPQSVANAEAGVAQTVQWVDDLLDLSTSDNTDTTPVDPTTAILDAAYGLNPTTSSTDPTTSLLESAYGLPGAGSTSSAPASGSTSSSAASTPAPAASGNNGSSASVNVYA
jgi:hypothetical protein